MSWPYFADQLLNKTYICDIWMNGLGFQKDENSIISREEITDKVNQLLSNIEFKTRALNLKEKVMNSIGKGGCSQKNLERFIEWIIEKDANGRNNPIQELIG